MFGRTTKRTATPGETEVVSAILHATGDPRADRLLAQFTAPGRLMRKVQGARLTCALDLVPSDLRVDVDGELRSRPVVVRDETTQVELTFTLTLIDGFLQELTAEAAAPTWPDLWSINVRELAQAAVGVLQLPSQQPVPVADVLEAVGCGDPVAPDAVTTRLPTTPAALDALVAAQGAELPEGMAQLLLVSDGLVVPPTTVLGAADTTLAEVPDLGRRWSLGFAGASTVFVWDDEAGVLVSDTPADRTSWLIVAPTYPQWISSLLSGR